MMVQVEKNKRLILISDVKFFFRNMCMHVYMHACKLCVCEIFVCMRICSFCVHVVSLVEYIYMHAQENDPYGSCTSVCMYSAHMHTHVKYRPNMRMYLCMYVHPHTHSVQNIHACVCMYMCVSRCVSASQTCVCVQVSLSLCIPSMYICNMCTWALRVHTVGESCMYAHMHVYMSTYYWHRKIMYKLK